MTKEEEDLCDCSAWYRPGAPHTPGCLADDGERAPLTEEDEYGPYDEHLERLDDRTATGVALSEWYAKELGIATALCATRAVHYNPQNMALQGLWNMAYNAGRADAGNK